ncbi:unnamed protein product [Timema podura]|uniref:Uncharacterized protein n=1 Tax=Timema podura TaxID=61482 RepID=A0ABN7P9Q3_TIMPD|nr:unnamed protein product [Timema podura]
MMGRSSKHLEEREKETKEFFKSESEESDTEDKNESRDKETTCNNSREKISSSQSSESNGPLKDSGIQSFSQSEREDTLTVSCDIVEELNTAIVTDCDNSLSTLIHKPSLKNIDDMCGTMNVMSESQELNKIALSNVADTVNDSNIFSVVESEDLVLKFSESQNMSDATKATKEKDDHDRTDENTDEIDCALKSIKDKPSKSSNNKGSEKDICLASFLKDIFSDKSVEDSGDEELEYNKIPAALKKSLALSGIVSAEKGSEGIESVVKDTVTVILGEDELSSAGEKPGTKMLRLRKELQQQISKRKSEEWSRRLQEAQLDNENVPTGIVT